MNRLFPICVSLSLLLLGPTGCYLFGDSSLIEPLDAEADGHSGDNDSGGTDDSDAPPSDESDTTVEDDPVVCQNSAEPLPPHSRQLPPVRASASPRVS